MNMPNEHTSDPLAHAQNIRRMLGDLARHAREDVGRVDDPKARALFETTAEVADGLARAYEHFAQRSEPAWQ